MYATLQIKTEILTTINLRNIASFRKLLVQARDGLTVLGGSVADDAYEVKERRYVG